MKTLYLCSTYYHTLITLLKCIDSNEENEIGVIGYIDNGEILARKIEQSGIVSKSHFLKVIHPRNKIESLFWKKYSVQRFQNEVEIDFREYDKIFCYMDATCYAKYLKDSHINYFLIEDSYDVFKIIDKSRFAFMLTYDYPLFRKLINIFFPNNFHNYKYFLDSNEIEGIEVNSKEGIVLKEDTRVKELPRVMLFNKINKYNIEKILRIYLDDTSFLNNKHIALVLTYCFYNDNQLKNDLEQKELYKKVVKLYQDDGFNVIIKPHPRDKVDYSDILHVNVLDKNFPSELIKYIDKGNIERYISIFSTATKSYPEEKVDFFDSIDTFMKIYEEKYGKI